MLEEYFAAHPIQSVRYAPQFPPVSDRARWTDVSDADRTDLLTLADTWRDQPYPMLTAGMYAAFRRTGSRRACEAPYFARRVKLIAAALGMGLTGSADGLGDVEDGLCLLCEETTWAISAHAGLSDDHPFPDDRGTIVDLFAAQTAMILSFVCQLLEGTLHPDLRERVRREVERRVLRPFMENDGEWWMGFVRRDLNNWTPWIVSNVLMSANVWHFGGSALILRAGGMLDRWLACVPEDGGCDEGAAYWNMAGGAFLDCLMLLERMCGVALWQNEKVRRIMAYPADMYLGGGWFANFADCDARPWLSGERLQYAGERTANPMLIRMGTEMRGVPSDELADTPHLSRLLMRLFSRPAAEAADAVRPDVWLPDLQVRVVRRGGLAAAMKGGHNGESHNHNDVGGFLLMADGEMQAVDAGNMVYTAKTFSDRRYELWNCRSLYHSVPIIGGQEQGAGARFAARDAFATPDGMALDMAGAYPPEANVRRCVRRFSLSERAFTVRDEIDADAAVPVTWVFMLRHEPLLFPGGCRLRGQSLTLRWESNVPLSAAAEAIAVDDVRMAKSYPGQLWRLTLTAAPAQHRTGTFVFVAE